MAFNNLYPPIMDTYMPAFAITINEDGKGVEIGEGVKISFSLSSFNSLQSIKSVWISITNQYTNESVVKPSTGVLLFPISEIGIDTYESGEVKYYIRIKSEDLEDEKGWRLGQNYKVQLRFCNASEAENKADWIVENSNLFSEWSTVCLITPILKPSIILNGLDENNETIFTSMSNHIVGRFITEDTETLESYTIQIYNKEDLTTPLYDSGIIYTNTYNPNEINYMLKYGYLEGVKYLLRFTYFTENLYTNSVDYDFMILDMSTNILNATLTATPLDELGCIELKAVSETETIFGNLTIRRTSHLSDFKIWEDIQNICLTDTEHLNLTWRDFSAESGVLYKYCIQKRDSMGNRGVAVITKEPVILYLEDMFLIGGGRALKIKFNPQISSYSQTVSEASVQTIGSKYPFIKRNSAVQYKQFSISGLISHLADDGHIFTDISELYNGYFNYFDEFNYNRTITNHNNLTLERNFRSQVEDFLYNGEVKLFKSPTEGNVLVRLMNISFTPETILGRMVYTFTATAYEINEPSLESIDKYKIQPIGTYTQIAKSKKEKIAIISDLTRKVDLKTYLQTLESAYDTEDKINLIQGISELTVQFESEPYLYFINTETGEPCLDTNGIPLKKGEDTDIPYLGYIIYINNKPFCLNADGYYHIEDMFIESFFYTASKSKMEATITCKYVVLEKENTFNDISLLRYYYKVGQTSGIFFATHNIAEDFIYPKGTYIQGNTFERIASIHNMTIETEPYTMLYLKDASSFEYKPVLVGATGTLNLEDLDYSIEGLYANGIYLTEKSKVFETQQYVESFYSQWQYEIDDNLYNLVSDIDTTLIPADTLIAYKVQNFYNIPTVSATDDYLQKLSDSIQKRKNAQGEEYYLVIFYHQNWYLLTKDNVLLCPVHLIADYYYELEKGEWKK